jgi:hypothetical protein
MIRLPSTFKVVRHLKYKELLKTDVRKSLAFTMAHPNKPVSFSNIPFRPSTSLLKDKGQYLGKAADHNKQDRRPDGLLQPFA